MVDDEDNPHVAVKELTAAQFLDTEQFHALASNESAILTRFQNQSHPHLIRVIAYYIQGKRHFFVFPWAKDGNLRDFWSKSHNLSVNHRPDDWITYLQWFFGQLVGLADAIKTLHHPKDNPDENCRHGDLKPENILCFSKAARAPKSLPTDINLVIADAGLARVHAKATEFRLEKTKTSGGTTMYSPPESELNAEQARTRRYDVWSLGCLYLEFVIWLLYGNEALENFRNVIGHDQPYYEKIPENRPEIRVKDVVGESIKAIKNDPRCSPAKETALGRLVDLIEHRFLVVTVTINHSDSFPHAKNPATTVVDDPLDNMGSPTLLLTRPTFRPASDESLGPQRADAIEMHDEIKKIFNAAQKGLLNWMNWEGLETSADQGSPFALTRQSRGAGADSTGSRLQIDRTIGVRHNVSLMVVPVPR
jgi:serine/threonine protein kinase